MYRNQARLELSRHSIALALRNSSLMLLRFWSSEVEHFDGQAKYNPNLAGRCAQWHRVCHRLSARRPDRVNLFNYRPPFNNAHSIADIGIVLWVSFKGRRLVKARLDRAKMEEFTRALERH
jgi:hypothetical protein